MSELDKISRDLLRAARAEFEPTEAERVRLAKMHEAILAGAVPGIPIDGIGNITSAGAAYTEPAAKAGSAAAFGTTGKAIVVSVFVAAAVAATLAVWPTSAPVVAPPAEPAHSDVSAPLVPTQVPSPGESPALAPSAPDIPAVRSVGAPRRERRIPSESETPEQRIVEEQTPQGLEQNESDSLREQARLIATARRSLESGDAHAAIDLLNQFRTGYPNAVLHQEEQATRILTLCALGRTSDAAAEAREFRRDFPSSPFRARVDVSCAPPAGN